MSDPLVWRDSLPRIDTRGLPRAQTFAHTLFSAFGLMHSSAHDDIVDILSQGSEVLVIGVCLSNHSTIPSEEWYERYVTLVISLELYIHLHGAKETFQYWKASVGLRSI